MIRRPRKLNSPSLCSVKIHHKNRSLVINIDTLHAYVMLYERILEISGITREYY